MQTILIVFHLFLAVGLIGLILIQHGKGADMGAAFGSGASGTVFGAKGSGSFLTRLTAGLATLFFITSMVMAYFAAQRDDNVDVLGGIELPAAVEEQSVPQSDIPLVPAADSSDMPPIVTDEPASEVPVAPVESGDVPAVDVQVESAVEAAVSEDAAATETPAPAENKE
jgi:preprotein translocase subunit SecG